MAGDIHCVNITIVDDSDLEGTETFSVIVESRGSDGRTTELLVTIYITDNDG